MFDHICSTAMTGVQLCLILTATLAQVSVIKSDDAGSCLEEFAGLKGSCACADSIEGDDAWCPNSEKPNIRLHLQPQALWVTCHDQGVTEEDMIAVLEKVSLGPTLTTVEFKTCPIPSSFGKLILAMNKTNLFELRATHCQTNELVRGQFEGLGSSLRRIRLTNNIIGQIHPDAFKGLAGLESLHMSNNKIVSFPSDGMFSDLTGLLSLEIIEKTLGHLPNGLFKSLKSLKNLEINVNVTPNANLFEENTNLISVVLTNIDGSQMLDEKNLPLFHHMPQLKNVTISGTNFSELPEQLFDSNPQLQFFTWAYDKCSQCFTEPKSFLRNLTELKSFEIILSYSKGLKLNEDFFWGCGNLQTVKMNRCRMTEIPELLFRDSLRLQNLDLSWNRIEVIPPKLFHPVSSLRTLNMEQNRIGAINDQHFQKANKLKILNLSNNNLSSISTRALVSLNSLEDLNLSNNIIFFDDTSEPLWIGMRSIESLDMSNNKIQISHVPEQFRTTYHRLQRLNLRNNSIGPKIEIWPDFFFHISGESVDVDLSSNNLDEVSYSLAYQHLSTISPSTRAPAIIDISKNPIACDCRNVNLALHLRDKLAHDSLTTWMNFKHDITCEGISLSKIDIRNLTCSFPSYYLRDACPSECRCDYAPYQSPEEQKGKITVDCSGRPSLPTFIPAIVNGGLVNDVALDLSKTSLNSTGHLRALIKDFDSVTRIALSQNNLETFAPEDLPANLVHLAIDGNHLEEIDIEGLVAELPSLQKIWIGGNPFLCDCESRQLYQLVTRNPGSMIQDANMVSLDCKANSMPILNISDYKEFCLEFQDLATSVALPASLVSILLLLFAIVFLVYRQTFFIWIYSKPMLRSLCFSADENVDKDYDVFISYSSVDKDFVEDQMVPILEDKSSDYTYRCIVHVRDFVPGRPINDQIIEAVDKSNRTLIVLSENFISSGWALQEFEIAQKRSKLIVVVKGAIPSKELMPEGLNEYVRSNTYLSWDDRWFWEKLRYALPHKGARARCCLSIFGRSNATRLNATSYAMPSNFESNNHVMTQSLESSTELNESNGISFSSILNGRANSVSPI